MTVAVSPPFHVTLDGFNLALPRGTGVATYARTLSEALKGMSAQVDVLYGFNIPSHTPAALREVLFYDRLGEEEPKTKARFLSERWKARQRSTLTGCTAQTVPADSQIDARSFSERMPAFDQLLNARDLFFVAAQRYRATRRFMTVNLPVTPDVMHWTYPFPIRVRGARNVYTVHDLVPLRLPHATLDDKSYYFRLMTDLCRHADAICTVSEASKRDIIAFSSQVAPLVHNTYQTIRSPAASLKINEETLKDVLERLYGLRRDGYYLFFGSIEPKKNIGRLLEAMLSSSAERPLVIVGAMAWKATGELRLLERCLNTGRVIRMEYLPERDLMTLVRGARALLFPSLAEGFGLPVIEAMTLGTPVMTSCEGALPEVGGDAVLTVDAYDIPQITAAIERLDRDDSLCAALRAAGPNQAARFDMSCYQIRLKAFYADVMRAPMKHP
ncbi:MULTISPECIES: glycosyltransferase family 4 protein [Gluconobacter]|uniref:glycosyltransferase family 4 protein n=1 Tax=Gluconobacter TaxID=441 RepID=UPI001B8CF5B2|nr:glycosyltransferase family 1 protein [Gluconobacter cerinus]MBS1032300.1 glycosyltransferase family 4 protein [Gluconobacter cerinus]MBS1035753.1 glycosyltransferase family 4 protein [Gluconobacter cerinus]